MTYKRIALSPCAIDITDEKFGMLTAIMPVGRDVSGNIQWLCKCECGNKLPVLRGNLCKGNSKSCGCDRMRGATKHGLAHTPEYKPWTTMKYRCDNPNNSSYHKYGARGIKVCKRWRDFAFFMKDMGSKPTSEHSIERIDNEGDYTPENCRWALPYEQARNTRQNRWITYNGKTLCLTDWSKKFGIKYQTLSHRLNNPKMSIHDAFTTPVRKRRKP